MTKMASMPIYGKNPVGVLNTKFNTGKTVVLVGASLGYHNALLFLTSLAKSTRIIDSGRAMLH